MSLTTQIKVEPACANEIGLTTTEDFLLVAVAVVRFRLGRRSELERDRGGPFFFLCHSGSRIACHEP